MKRKSPEEAVLLAKLGDHHYFLGPPALFLQALKGRAYQVSPRLGSLKAQASPSPQLLPALPVLTWVNQSRVVAPLLTHVSAPLAGPAPST